MRFAVGTTTVAVMAPGWGNDLSYITDVDPSVRVLDCGEVFRTAVEELEASADGALRSDSESYIDRAVSEALGDADVLLIGYPVLPRLAALTSHLRWVHHTQAGASNFLASDLWASDVILTTSRGLVAPTAIAEYVIAAVGAFSRGLYELTLTKVPLVQPNSEVLYRTVRGSTMGIVGLGGIGREVARLSHLLGMRVLATRATLASPQTNCDYADFVYPADQLLNIVGECDYVAVCSQLTPKTRGLIDEEVFRRMRSNAVLINIARGEEVDEDALVEAVETRSIRGAVLDVYAGELEGRPPRTELMQHPAILLTPHIAGHGDPSDGTLGRRLFASNLRRYLDGAELENRVNRLRGY